MKRRSFLVALAAAVGGFSANAKPAPDLRILFIGNSYTFYNNLPDTIAALGMRDGLKWTVARYLRGGAFFQTHWCDNLGTAEGAKSPMALDPKRKGALDRLLKEKWDVVVLQAQSQEAIHRPDGFFDYGKRLVEKVKAAGCPRVLLYGTWARQHIPSQQAGLTAAYAKLAAETGAELVRVGDAWAAAFAARPGLVLHNPDKSHPNDKGSYLAACLFYRALAGKSAKGLPYELKNVKWNGKPCYHLDAETAAFLQSLAEPKSHQEEMK